jgi:PAS domain S-box-containing protein
MAKDDEQEQLHLVALRNAQSILFARVEAEESLRKQSDWLRVTLSSIGDAVISTDAEGRVTFLNGVAEALTGWTNAEATGRPLPEVFVIVNEGTRQPVENPALRALREGIIVGLANHTLLIARDGTERPIDDSAAPIRDDAGTILGAVLVFRDVTERRRVEATLRRKEAELTDFIENAAVGMHWVAPDGTILWANKAELDLLGYTREEYIGRHIAEFHVDRAVIDELLGRLENQEVLRGFEAKLRCKDGSIKHVVINSSGLWENGRFIHSRCFTHDVTDKRRADEAQARLAAIVESSDDAIISKTLDGTITSWNRGAERIFGYTAAEAVGRSIMLVIPRERWDEEDAILARLRRGERVEHFETVRVTKDGRLIDVSVTVSPLVDSEGRVIGASKVGRDITARKRTDEALREAKRDAEEANNAKTQFLAVLSHELRTPLNPILLAVTAMLEKPEEPEQLRATLQMIRQNVALQARLIDDLLDVMRIVRGKFPLHWEVVNAHRVIEHAIEVCRSEVLGKELRVAAELTATEHHVNADPARLQQVFWNLIKNAVKFTPGGGSITIRTRNERVDRSHEAQLVVEVSDTGIGIDPAALATIFDPFQQAETTITRTYGGLGLGLAICRGIIEAHGGTLVAQSAGKHCGSTFRIALNSLPTPQAQRGIDQETDASERASAATASLRLLVVEDEPATLRLMARLLTRMGHTVMTAGTIATALEILQANPCDLIISDIGLPDGSGLDFMNRVVSTRGRLPAIALTGYGMEEDIRRSKEAGFAAHLTKPIDFTKLTAMIQRLTQ